MPGTIPDDVLQKNLENIADNGNKLDLCSAQPANYAGIAAVSLGQVTLTTGDGNGDYNISDGSISGRRLRLAAQTVLGTGTGTGTQAVISDSVNEKIKVSNPYTVAVQNGVNVQMPAYDIVEIRDPS